jgi:tetratricopeptide (TPR) repeat protein
MTEGSVPECHSGSNVKLGYSFSRLVVALVFADNWIVAQPALTTCSGCGVASQLHEAFRYDADPNSVRKFCPPCWKRRNEAHNRTHLITYLCLGAGGVVLAVINSQWGFLLLTFFLFHVFGILGTAPHEIGHALAARALNLHVYEVVIGFGKKLFQCRISGVLVELRAIPYGGYTLAVPMDGRFVRIRDIVYALAGPVANLVVALVVFAVAGWDRIADFRPHEKISPWSLLFASNALIFVSNLIPRSDASETRRSMSDGMHLIRALTMKQEDLDRFRAMTFAVHWNAAQERGDMRSAAAWIDRGLQEFPENRALLAHRASYLTAAERFDEARSLFKRLLEEADADNVAERALLMNDIAYVNLLMGRKELLDEADSYSDHALKVFPWSAFTKGLRGAVFVGRGQLADGIGLLQHSLQESEEPAGRAQSACWLAIAEAQRGNYEAARSYVNIARDAHPESFLIARAERAINEKGDRAA